MTEMFVAVSPDTGAEYTVFDRAELVNLIARGYQEKNPEERPAAVLPAPERVGPTPRPPEAAARREDDKNDK